jgi:hypothetical protein
VSYEAQSAGVGVALSARTAVSSRNENGFLLVWYEVWSGLVYYRGRQMPLRAWYEAAEVIFIPAEPFQLPNENFDREKRKWLMDPSTHRPLWVLCFGTLAAN